MNGSKRKRKANYQANGVRFPTLHKVKGEKKVIFKMLIQIVEKCYE
nr:MAG TPA: hypothetical protein [Caudoviricetes sp.]